MRTDREKARQWEKAWRARNPDRVAAYERKRREKYPEKRRAAAKKCREFKNYGVDPGWRENTLREQGGSCAACRTSIELRHSHIDHDHATDEVRGVLCRSCNVALGWVADDPARLRMLAAYLERHGK